MKSLFFFGSLSAVALVSLAAACGDDDFDPASDIADATTSSSSGVVSSSSSSSGSSSGGSSSGSTTSSSGGSSGAALLPTTCDGDCRTMSLRVEKGERSGQFERAFYGLNSDGSVHVEAHRGGEAKCAQEDSATPDFTMIIVSPVPAPLTYTREDGARSSFLDFVGAVEDAPIVSAPSVVEVRPQAALLDQSEQAFYAFDVRAEFAGGARAEGHVFATHCPIMDE